jgi:hypothetical protein
MIKAVVAVMNEGGSCVVIRGVRHGSGLHQADLGDGGINSATPFVRIRITLEVGCPPPGIGAKISRKFLETCFGITYNGGSVALEYGVVDLNSACSISINGSTLEVACPPPGIGAKI